MRLHNRGLICTEPARWRVFSCTLPSQFHSCQVWHQRYQAYMPPQTFPLPLKRWMLCRISVSSTATRSPFRIVSSAPDTVYNTPLQSLFQKVLLYAATSIKSALPCLNPFRI